MLEHTHTHKDTNFFTWLQQSSQRKITIEVLQQIERAHKHRTENNQAISDIQENQNHPITKKTSK